MLLILCTGQGGMPEARRTELYQEMEVSENRHQKYEQGKVSVEGFTLNRYEMFS